jgi:hypothetical protein
MTPQATQPFLPLEVVPDVIPAIELTSRCQPPQC